MPEWTVEWNSWRLQSFHKNSRSINCMRKAYVPVYSHEFVGMTSASCSYYIYIFYSIWDMLMYHYSPEHVIPKTRKIPNPKRKIYGYTCHSYVCLPNSSNCHQLSVTVSHFPLKANSISHAHRFVWQTFLIRFYVSWQSKWRNGIVCFRFFHLCCIRWNWA